MNKIMNWALVQGDYNKRAKIAVIIVLERKEKYGVPVKYIQGNHDQILPNFMNLQTQEDEWAFKQDNPKETPSEP